MSEIRSMLEDTVTKVMKNQCTKELITDAEKGTFPTALWGTLEELGVTAVGIDEENGGSGGDLGDLMALLKITGYYAAPIPLAEHILSNWILSRSGLPCNNGISTFGPVLEEGRIHFEEATDGWIIFGRAKYIPWARNAKYITVFGNSSENNYLIANVPLEQCIITPHESLAGEPRDEVLFDQVLVNKEAVANFEDHKIADLFDKASLARVMLMTGALERILELSVTHSKERSQFGRSISKFQAIQQQLAILAGETSASMVVADFIMNNIDQQLSRVEVEIAKIQLGEAVGVATRIAHQVHAAMGFTDEHPLHQSTRRLWSWRDEFGTEATLAKTLGEKVLDNNSRDLWGFLTNPIGS